MRPVERIGPEPGMRPVTGPGDRPSRAEVWKLLGAPTDQVGSVNDPRFQDEHGARWNEKWIYRSEDDGSVRRIVLWNRYDLVGVFRLERDGSAESEALPKA
jgi:hypothetical protein